MKRPSGDQSVGSMRSETVAISRTSLGPFEGTMNRTNPDGSREAYTILEPSGDQAAGPVMLALAVRRVRVPRTVSYTQMSLFGSPCATATRRPSGERRGQ